MGKLLMRTLVDGSPKCPAANCNSCVFVNLAAAEFAFSLCHKVCCELNDGVWTNGIFHFKKWILFSGLCLAILTLLVIYKLTLLNCGLTQAGQDQN